MRQRGKFLDKHVPWYPSTSRLPETEPFLRAWRSIFSVEKGEWLGLWLFHLWNTSLFYSSGVLVRESTVNFVKTSQHSSTRHNWALSENTGRSSFWGLLCSSVIWLVQIDSNSCGRRPRNTLFPLMTTRTNSGFKTLEQEKKRHSQTMRN
jgi:hypothetical protein